MSIRNEFHFSAKRLKPSTLVGICADIRANDNVVLTLAGELYHEIDDQVLMEANMSVVQAEKLALRILECCAWARVAARQVGPWRAL